MKFAVVERDELMSRVEEVIDVYLECSQEFWKRERSVYFAVLSCITGGEAYGSC